MNTSTFRCLLYSFFFLPFISTAQNLPFLEDNNPESLLSGILDIFGLNTRDIQIEPNEKIENASAHYQNGQRYIYYKPKWINNLGSSYGTSEYWLKMGVIMHEVGHHMKGHSISSENSTPILELEADEWAGFAMAKINSTLPLALKYLETNPEFDTQTHPSRKRREASVRAGYYSANGSFKLSEDSRNKIIDMLTIATTPKIPIIVHATPQNNYCRVEYNQSTIPKNISIDDNLTTLHYDFVCSITEHRYSCGKDRDKHKWDNTGVPPFPSKVEAKLEYKNGVLYIKDIRHDLSKYQEADCYKPIEEHLVAMSGRRIALKWQ